MSKTTLLTPRLSEKSYGLSQRERTYVFDVPTGTNKHDVARAVAAQFDVKVLTVNMATIPGKAKRTITKRRQYRGRDVVTRKAYVRIAEGQTLPIFAAVEEAEVKEEKTQATIDKAVAKQAEKEAKPARRGLRRTKKTQEIVEETE
jgi:large subunit ribosomal protein L23